MQMIPDDPFPLSTSSGVFSQEQNTKPNPKPNPPPAAKKKRNLPGTPGAPFLLQTLDTRYYYYYYFLGNWVFCCYFQMVSVF